MTGLVVGAGFLVVGLGTGLRVVGVAAGFLVEGGFLVVGASVAAGSVAVVVTTIGVGLAAPESDEPGNNNEPVDGAADDEDGCMAGTAAAGCGFGLSPATAPMMAEPPQQTTTTPATMPRISGFLDFRRGGAGGCGYPVSSAAGVAGSGIAAAPGLYSGASGGQWAWLYGSCGCWYGSSEFWVTGPAWSLEH
jgi:hypothetical protein